MADYDLSGLIVGQAITFTADEGNMTLTRVESDVWYMQGQLPWCPVARRCTPYGSYDGTLTVIANGILSDNQYFDYAIGPRRLTLHVLTVTPP